MKILMVMTIGIGLALPAVGAAQMCDGSTSAPEDAARNDAHPPVKAVKPAATKKPLPIKSSKPQAAPATVNHPAKQGDAK
jgi:hypothetical protein